MSAPSLRRLACAAAALAAGAAAGAAHLPGRWGLLSWLAYAPLLALAADAPAARAAALGALFGAAVQACGTPWLYGLTRGFMRLGAVPGALLAGAVWTALGLRWALPAWAASSARGLPAKAAAFAAAGAACERFFPTFCPSQLAFTQLFHLPTVQSTALVGEPGFALFVLSVNAAAWLLWRERGARAAAAAAAAGLLAVANEAWGRHEMARLALAASAAPQLRVAVAQAGSGSAPWGEPARDEAPLYARLTREAAAAGTLDLVVWPENSVPGPLRYGARDALPAAVALEPGGPPVLVNAIGVGDDGLSRNVSLLAGAGGRILGAAEKRVLMPFGEFLPAGLGLLDRVIPGRERLSPGRAPGLLALGGGARVGVAICFESVVPAPPAELAARGAQLLVAQSNDSWFGPPHPEQHLMFSVLRAVENRRALAQASRDGVSALVLPDGRVLRRLEVGRAGAAAGALPLLDERWPGARAGEWLARGAVLLALGLAASGRRSAA